MEKTGGLLGLDQSSHQFKKNPLRDRRLSIDNQGLESGFDFGVPRRTKRVDPDRGVNEKSGISPEMAIRLEKWFGSSAEMWYGLQMEYNLAQAEKHADKIKVKRISQNQLAC